jgi:hypothetical protein
MENENKTGAENDWKGTIGNYFAKNGIFRIEYLNKNLKLFCDEYVKYFSEFHRVSTSLKSEYYEGVMGYQLKFGMPTVSSHPFVLFCVFNLEGHLFLKVSVDFDFSSELKGLFKDENEDKDFYIYSEEKLAEPEMHEKEYLFQLFNARFIQYIETIKVSQINNLSQK